MALQPEKQRMFELPADQPVWTPFLEEINDLMLEEKQARHDNDHVKVAEICLRIVSNILQSNIRLHISVIYNIWLTTSFIIL